MEWQHFLYKIVPLVAYIFAFSLVGIRQAQKARTTFMLIFLAVIGYFFISDFLYISILVAFLIIGLCKLINKAIDHSEVLHNYNIKNFLYSGLPPFLLGIASHFFQSPILDLLACVALGVGISDTVSSELGSAIKGRTYNIVNFQRITPGMNGGVSIEGSALGFIGALIFSLLACYVFNIFSIGNIILFSLLSFGGNLMDSLLGATLQKKEFLNNEQVNLVSILFIVFVGYFLLK